MSYDYKLDAMRWTRVRLVASALRERARSLGHGDLPRWLERQAKELEDAAPATDVEEPQR
jgi:hypothetical protein